jgi:hypothetical protein
MPIADPNSPFGLTTVKPDGALPKARLNDANVAQQIYWTTHQSNLSRNNYGAYLQGVCDGNPPYRQSRLRVQGQGWRANFSTRESKARKSSAKTPYYDLFASGPTYAEVRTFEKGKIDPVTASRIQTEEFYEMQRTWSGFDWNMWKMLDCFVGFGRGWLFWPETDVWQFKRIPWWRVRFPDGTDVDPDEWELFTIEHIYNPVKLNAFARDEASASAAGWNISRVRQAIANATPLDPNAAQDQMLVQQMIKDQDIQLMYRSATIQAASILVREFDGTWSRMIVETGKTSNSDLSLGRSDWLFYKRGIAESVHQIIAPFIFEVETGSINGLTGILGDITDMVKTKNRMRCEQVNNVFLRSTVLMQANSASSRVKSGLITVGGGVTLIPEGLAVQQSTILGDVQSTLVVNEDMDRELDTNTGVFRPQMEKPQGNPEPLGTTQLRYAQSSVLTNSAVNRFLQQLDWCYTEMYRRATLELPDNQSHPAIKAALEFQRICKERGVSQKQLRNVAWVRAVRVIGNGSPGMRSQLTQEIAAFTPVLGLGQRGRKNLSEAIIAARGGQDMVERLMPVEDQEDLPSEQDREALQENGMVKIGSPVLIIENDDHPVHLRRHFEAAFAAIAAVQQGAPPMEAAAFVKGILPHIAGHIQLLEDKDLQKNAVKSFRELQKQYDQLIQALQENQPDPEKQQQIMDDAQLKQFDTQNKIQDRNLKTQAALRDKEIKSRHAMIIQAAEAQQRLQIADADSASKITRQSLETVAKINSQKRNGEGSSD